MKRYVCTVATGLLLALVSTGSAAAGLPLLGNTQDGSQSTSFGDQTVGEQKNDANVNQAQGNGNVNVSPAIAIFGDATTWNAQGNGNTARADVDQSNTATQTQESTQSQELEQGGSKGNGRCCGGQSQTGEQSTDFGDQTVDKQKNEAEVNQEQGNDNLNISPALAIFGDATTKNAQGNGNTADANVEQDNTATQSQSSSQSQSLEQGGSSSQKGSKSGHCCAGQSQTGTQETTFGDQTVGEQKNDANVNQAQGNGNVNVSPAIAIFGDATTWNAQGNGNTARADVDQSNTATQTQESTQSQELEQGGSKGNGRCCGGQSQTGEQSTDFGDQTVDKQKNEAEVNQEQGNDNLNISPALAIGGHESSCSSKCGGDRKQHGGASTFNSQGNGNTARANVGQSNEVTQSQSATQTQNLRQPGGSCCKPRGGWKPPENGCKPAPHGNVWTDSTSCGKDPKGGCRSPQGGQFNAHGNAPSCIPAHQPGGKAECCDGEVQTASQSASFGDQTVGEQKNEAAVTQYQGNENENVSPVLAFGGDKKHSCGCKHAKPASGHGGASTWNFQGNGNAAQADLDQGNTADQSQASGQDQSLAQGGRGVSLS